MITQRALKIYVELQKRLDLISKELDYALYCGADVEMGILDAGVFVESARKPNWRTEFVDLGGDPKTILDKTPWKEYCRTRVFLSIKPPKGRRVAPTPLGEPLEGKPCQEETENGQDR